MDTQAVQDELARDSHGLPWTPEARLIVRKEHGFLCIWDTDTYAIEDKTSPARFPIATMHERSGAESMAKTLAQAPALLVALEAAGIKGFQGWHLMGCPGAVQEACTPACDQARAAIAAARGEG